MADEECLDKTALEKLNRLGGPEFLVKMIDLFLENAPRRLETARAGEEAGDLEAVERAVHSLRSSAGNLGAGVLQKLAEKIERLAEEKKGDTIPSLLCELESAFALVKACLGKQRENLNA